MSKIYKKWQEFILNERNYTKEELASDSRWNDLSQGEIDGFFWTAAGGASLEDLTRAIYGLAEDAGRSLETDDEWLKFRNEVMAHEDFLDAAYKIAPQAEIPSIVDVVTDPGSPGAAKRQLAKKKGKDDLQAEAESLILQSIKQIEKEYPDIQKDEILRLFSDAIKAEKLPLANTIQRTSYK